VIREQRAECREQWKGKGDREKGGGRRKTGKQGLGKE
jgi:hypothetical protein